MPDEAMMRGETQLFGMRVVFESDTQAALDAALDGRGDNSIGAGHAVRIALRGYAVNRLQGEQSWARGDRLSMRRDGFRIEADGNMGHGRCDYPHDLVGSAGFAEMIETLMLFLVAHAGRIPLHASAVMLDDRAIVLAGKSGMGKSSLALAANRRGLPVLSDDTVFIEAAPHLRVWSRSRAIHVFEKDAASEAAAGLRFRSGRWKRIVPVAAPRAVADRAVLCVLARGPRVSLTPLNSEQAVAALTAAPEPGYELYGSRSADAVRAVAADGCWQLTLSHDPDAAIALLAACFGDGVLLRATA